MSLYVLSRQQNNNETEIFSQENPFAKLKGIILKLTLINQFYLNIDIFILVKNEFKMSLINKVDKILSDKYNNYTQKISLILYPFQVRS